jgi:hypothetical protein
VAAALPKTSIRTLGLGDRSSPSSVTRALPSGFRHTCSASAITPPKKVLGGHYSAFKKGRYFLSKYVKGDPVALCGVGTPAPICALKLGDRSSPSGVTRGLFAGFKRSCGVTAAALPMKLKGGARTVFQESKCANFLEV